MGNKIKKEIISSINKIISSGFFIGGEEVDNFENKAAKFLNAKYSIAVNSGTDALFLSLKALGVRANDEVITSPFTFIATAEVIANLGAKPVFVDIRPDTFNINPELIEKAITSKTKAIIPVHLFGQPAEMDKVMVIAKKHKLKVIEDTAQSFGAKIGKNMAGTLGDTGAFSFFPSKNLGCFGDGGMVATKDKNIFEKIRLLRNHGSSLSDKYKNLILGTNSRLDAIQAAVLGVKIKYIKDWNRKRIVNARYYDENLKDIREIVLPKIKEGHVFNQYTIRVKNRDKLALYLSKNGLSARIYYPLPLHMQPAFKYLKYKTGDFPVSEKAAKEVLSLPVYPELQKKQQDSIIKAIKDFYEKK